MRDEIRIANDSRSFSLTSAQAAARLVGGSSMAELAAEGALAMVDLGQDEYFVGRLVVDEDLLPEELDSWVLRLRRPLSLPDGKLRIAGHCDSRGCWETELDKQREWIPRGYVTMRGFDLEPGDYRLDVYVLGAARIVPRLLRQALGMRPLRWWREQDPRPAMPPWLGCQAFEDWDLQDPEGEDLWRRLAEEINAGRVAIEAPAGAGVAYLFHLVKDGDTSDSHQPDEHGVLRTYPFRPRRGMPRRPMDGTLRQLSALPPRIDTPQVERDDCFDWKDYGVNAAPDDGHGAS